MEEAIGIIQKEIEWSRENAGNNPSEFRLGFIRGLEQAQALIKAFTLEQKLTVGGYDIPYGEDNDLETDMVTIKSIYGDVIGRVRVR